VLFLKFLSWFIEFGIISPVGFEMSNSRIIMNVKYGKNFLKLASLVNVNKILAQHFAGESQENDDKRQ
jgi:hypothetical protein